jgi:hypothetical protein
MPFVPSVSKAPLTSWQTYDRPSRIRLLDVYSDVPAKVLSLALLVQVTLI